MKRTTWQAFTKSIGLLGAVGSLGTMVAQVIQGGPVEWPFVVMVLVVFGVSVALYRPEFVDWLLENHGDRIPFLHSHDDDA